jgi:hypothetical protein
VCGSPGQATHYYFCSLFYDAVSISDSMSSNVRSISEQSVGKDSEGHNGKAEETYSRKMLSLSFGRGTSYYD